MNRNIFLLSVAFFFIFFSFSGAQQFVTSIAASAGNPEIGFWSLLLIYSTFSLSSLPAAWVSRRIGFKRAMILGAMAYAVYIVSLAVVNIPLLLASSIFVGAGAAILWVAQGECLIAIAEKKRIGEASGIFLSFWSVSSIASIVLMGIFLDKFALFQRTLLLVLSAGPLVGGAVLLGVRSPEGWRPAAVDTQTVLKNFNSRTLLRLSSIWFFMLAVAGYWLSTLSLNFVNKLGATQAGILGSLLTGMPVIVSFILGKLSDRHGRRVMILSGLFLCTISLIVQLIPISFLLVVSAVSLSMGFAVLRVSTFAIVGDLSTQKTALTLNAFLWTVSNIGVVFAVLIGWWMNGTTFPVVTLTVLAVVTCFFVFPLLKMPVIALKKMISEETA